MTPPDPNLQKRLDAAARLLRSHGYKVLGMGCPARSGAIAKTYGRLRVLERVENSPRGAARYLCQCECGNQKVVSGVDLRFGSTKSCGCLRNQFGFRKPTTPPLRTVAAELPEPPARDECQLD